MLLVVGKLFNVCLIFIIHCSFLRRLVQSQFKGAQTNLNHRILSNYKQDRCVKDEIPLLGFYHHNISRKSSYLFRTKC